MQLNLYFLPERNHWRAEEEILARLVEVSDSLGLKLAEETDSLLNGSIDSTMNKTCTQSRWCRCRLHVESGIVGSWCVKHKRREWGVINNDPGAAGKKRKGAREPKVLRKGGSKNWMKPVHKPSQPRLFNLVSKLQPSSWCPDSLPCPFWSHHIFISATSSSSSSF